MAQSESRHPSNIIWIVLTGILGVFALAGQKSSTENTPSTTGKESTEERTKGSPPVGNDVGSRGPLDDFFALDSSLRHPFTEKDGNCYKDIKAFVFTVPRTYVRAWFLTAVL